MDGRLPILGSLKHSAAAEAAVAAADTMAVVRTVVHGVEENRMEMSWMKTLELTMPLAQEMTATQMLGAHLIAAVVFSLVGIVVFALCLFLMDKITPFSIVKEIGEEHNVALGIIVGAIVLGISIIVAAAIQG